MSSAALQHKLPEDLNKREIKLWFPPKGPKSCVQQVQKQIQRPLCGGGDKQAAIHFKPMMINFRQPKSSSSHVWLVHPLPLSRTCLMLDNQKNQEDPKNGLSSPIVIALNNICSCINNHKVQIS